jgi:hypothetical protein
MRAYRKAFSESRDFERAKTKIMIGAERLRW